MLKNTLAIFVFVSTFMIGYAGTTASIANNQSLVSRAIDTVVSIKKTNSIVSAPSVPVSCGVKSITKKQREDLIEKIKNLCNKEQRALQNAIAAHKAAQDYFNSLPQEPTSVKEQMKLDAALVAVQNAAVRMHETETALIACMNNRKTLDVLKKACQSAGLPEDVIKQIISDLFRTK